MITSPKTPLALIAVLAMSAACASKVAPVSEAANASADVHVAMPGYKNSKDALGLDQPPIVIPDQPIMKPASVTFASSREFQDFPVQPVTNSIFLDEGVLNFGNEHTVPGVVPARLKTVAAMKPAMIPTQYREVIKRTAMKTSQNDAAVYGSTFGGLLVE